MMPSTVFLHSIRGMCILFETNPSNMTRMRMSLRLLLQQQQHKQPHLRSISYAALTRELTTDDAHFQNRPSPEQLSFGKVFSDHMLMIPWNKDTQWDAPQIVPYQNLSLSPAASCLHYGLQCFEGMKAYRAVVDDGSVRLFRPDKNMERLSNSMHRLCLPGYDFNRNELIRCIAELVKIDQRWIPQGGRGGNDSQYYSLYIRPTVIATHKFLGLAAPEELLLYVITSPVGAYYANGFRPVKLTTETPYVRAWPGGTGMAKVGGNYAATMRAQYEAAKQHKGGYDQVLWLFGDDEQITEVGAMNVFFVFQQNGGNKKELVTPPLTRGDILPGVTRDSILTLARTLWQDDLIVSERFPTMPEIQQAANDGTLLEAFGAGTAAVVTPIASIRYRGQDIHIQNPSSPTTTTTGEITQRIWDTLTGIQYGTMKGPEGWSVPIA
jgi:branched-chain amino acid aminotransferase